MWPNDLLRGETSLSLLVYSSVTSLVTLSLITKGYKLRPKRSKNPVDLTRLRKPFTLI